MSSFERIKIRVFPDHMSSGLWQWNTKHVNGSGGANLHESYFGDYIAPEIMIALKYWHWIWEMNEESWRNYGEPSYERLKKEFDMDGLAMTAAMNGSQGRFQFIYQESF